MEKETMSETNIYQKLKRVQQNSQSIPENGWNAYSKYSYPLFSDIVDTLKPQLEKENLFLYFDVEEYEAYRTSDGKKNVATIQIRAVVVDCETGATLSSRCPGYAEDTSDKALYQCHTNCRKYSLLALFGLRVGEDQEHTPTEGATQQRPAKENKQSASNKKNVDAIL